MREVDSCLTVCPGEHVEPVWLVSAEHGKVLEVVGPGDEEGGVDRHHEEEEEEEELLVVADVHHGELEKDNKSHFSAVHVQKHIFEGSIRAYK